MDRTLRQEKVFLGGYFKLEYGDIEYINNAMINHNQKVNQNFTAFQIKIFQYKKNVL